MQTVRSRRTASEAHAQGGVKRVGRKVWPVKRIGLAESLGLRSPAKADAGGQTAGHIDIRVAEQGNAVRLAEGIGPLGEEGAEYEGAERVELVLEIVQPRNPVHPLERQA